MITQDSFGVPFSPPNAQVNITMSLLNPAGATLGGTLLRQAEHIYAQNIELTRFFNLSVNLQGNYTFRVCTVFQFIIQ